MPSKEDLEKLRILHDKIKNHEFRKNPQKYLLYEYAELFDKDVLKIIGQFVQDGYDKNHCRTYKYYRYVRDRWLHFKDKNSKDGYFHYNDCAEIYSNPSIGIYNYAMHDFRSILSILKMNWDNDFYFKDYFARFTETTEKLLILIHNLVDGKIITEMRLPVDKEFSDKQTEYVFVQNPLYDNDWTLKKYLHKVWWEDKGYED